MLVCIISDTHIHPFARFGHSPGSNNARVKISLSCLDSAIGICKQLGIKHLIHAGDVFHARDLQRYPVFNQVFDKFRSLSKEVSLHFLVGNHDIVDDKGTLTIDSFRSFAEVYPDSAYVPELNVAFLPFVTNSNSLITIISQIPKEACIIGHFGVHGAQVGSAIHSADRDIEPEHFSEFKSTLLGHFHKVQKVGPVQFLGVLTPLDFNDLNQPGSFWTLNTDTGEAKRFILQGCPLFVEFDPLLTPDSETFIKTVKQNYVRMRVAQSEVWVKLLKKYNAAGWEWVGVKEETESSQQRIRDIKTLTLGDILKEYIEINPPIDPQLTKDKVLKTGLEVLQKVSM